MVENLREMLSGCLKTLDLEVAGFFLTFRELKSEIYDIDKEPDYIQHRFVIKLFDEFFSKILTADELRAKKTITLSCIFGRDKALSMIYNEAHYKGTPPIGFLDYAFGDVVAQQIISMNESRLSIGDIRKEDDYNQILFVKHILDNDIRRIFPESADRLTLKFARYLKYGREREELLGEVLSSNDLTPQQFTSVIGKFYLEKASYDKKKQLGRPQEQQFSQPVESDSDTQLNDKLMRFLGQFVGYEDVRGVISHAMMQAGIVDPKDASFNDRNNLVAALMENPVLSGMSVQRQGIVISLLLAWLNL